MSKASEFLAIVKERPKFRAPAFTVELADNGMLGFYAGNGDRIPIVMGEDTARRFQAWLSDLFEEAPKETA